MNAALYLPSRALVDVAAELDRQTTREPFTQKHRQWTNGQLIRAAVNYAMLAMVQSLGRTPNRPPVNLLSGLSWPWPLAWWRPRKTPRENLLTAAAILIAQIEVLDAEAAKSKGTPENV